MLLAADQQDLVEYGLIPEFVGRFATIVPLQALTGAGVRLAGERGDWREGLPPRAKAACGRRPRAYRPGWLCVVVWWHC